ncbi:hypothetical protein [Natrinema caseinilyticum]|uniref:hypothetical protein n=1 Tax=Natrinema caseinilyticum TaxID=2961570 RepID=UPI0020C25994|nr:hypothetical protein [Natrinema caseinilyticum]
MSEPFSHESRRRFLNAVGATTGALTLGATGSATAQETSTEGGSDADEGRFQEAITTTNEFTSGAIFRVASPQLEDAPVDAEVVRNYGVRIIEYFNTNEELYLFVPPNAQIEQGEVYVFDDMISSPTDEELAAENLVRVEYRPIQQEGLPFEYDEEEDFEIVENNGGEAAVRPDDFYSRALFEITSGAQGWIPQDVEQSGLFTDYNTVHATYLGSNRRFLLFAQEGARTETGQLYVMRDESELFDPAGNLVAVEFDAVDEDSLTFDDELLRTDGQ